MSRHGGETRIKSHETNFDGPIQDRDQELPKTLHRGIPDALAGLGAKPQVGLSRPTAIDTGQCQQVTGRREKRFARGAICRRGFGQAYWPAGRQDAWSQIAVSLERPTYSNPSSRRFVSFSATLLVLSRPRRFAKSTQSIAWS